MFLSPRGLLLAQCHPFSPVAWGAAFFLFSAGSRAALLSSYSVPQRSEFPSFASAYALPKVNTAYPGQHSTRASVGQEEGGFGFWAREGFTCQQFFVPSMEMKLWRQMVLRRGPCLVRLGLCGRIWPGTCYVVKAGLEFMSILLT